MLNLAYTIGKKRQSVYIKTYAVLCLIAILSLGFYSFQKWQEYNLVNEAVSKNKEFIVLLRDQTANEKSEYETNKSDFDSLDKEIEEKLTYVFPSVDEYTTLTRQLDSYEEELSKKNSIFEVSNIDYQSPVVGEEYSILPFRMSIRSSPENFTEFLHLMESSGSLTDQVRLMDISSIRLNFESSEGEDVVNKSNIINFTVQINAYFQK